MLLGVSAGIFQRALVDKSAMIRPHMGSKIDHKWSQCVEGFVQYHPVTVTSSTQLC
jgi:hypothetical protein